MIKKMNKNKSTNQIQREQHQLDASGRIAGRLASEAAILLMGKHKVNYQPNIDAGDFVEIANVDKMKFSGNKMEQKVYYHVTGYIGGVRETPLKKFFQEKPDELFIKMIKNMLPKNKLRKEMLKRLTFKK